VNFWLECAVQLIPALPEKIRNPAEGDAFSSSRKDGAVRGRSELKLAERNLDDRIDAGITSVWPAKLSNF
jgi:hypothetical protein